MFTRRILSLATFAICLSFVGCGKEEAPVQTPEQKQQVVDGMKKYEKKDKK